MIDQRLPDAARRLGGVQMNKTTIVASLVLGGMTPLAQADIIYVDDDSCVPHLACCFPTGDPVCDNGLNLIVKDIACRSASACQRLPCMKQATAT